MKFLINLIDLISKTQNIFLAEERKMVDPASESVVHSGVRGQRLLGLKKEQLMYPLVISAQMSGEKSPSEVVDEIVAALNVLGVKIEPISIQASVFTGKILFSIPEYRWKANQIQPIVNAVGQCAGLHKETVAATKTTIVMYHPE